MITTSIKLSIEVENGDETEKDEFLNTISHLYHYEFVKENSGYGQQTVSAVSAHARCSSQLREKKKTLPRRRGRSQEYAL